MKIDDFKHHKIQKANGIENAEPKKEVQEYNYPVILITDAVIAIRARKPSWCLSMSIIFSQQPHQRALTINSIHYMII